jgi:hypothetical protein
MTSKYTAQVVEVPGEGVRLEPTAGSTTPELPNELNLLAMSVALALGRASYEHHPEPRDQEVQTIEALLAGKATMPWRRSKSDADTHYVSCEESASGVWTCEVRTQH